MWNAGTGGSRAGGRELLAGPAALSSLKHFNSMPPGSFTIGDLAGDELITLEIGAYGFERIILFEIAALYFIGLLQSLPSLGDLGNQHALVRVSRRERLCEIVAETVGFEATRHRVAGGGGCG